MCPWKRDHINVKNYVSEIDAYLFEIKKKQHLRCEFFFFTHGYIFYQEFSFKNFLDTWNFTPRCTSRLLDVCIWFRWAVGFWQVEVTCSCVSYGLAEALKRYLVPIISTNWQFYSVSFLELEPFLTFSNKP